MTVASVFDAARRLSVVRGKSADDQYRFSRSGSLEGATVLVGPGNPIYGDRDGRGDAHVYGKVEVSDGERRWILESNISGNSYRSGSKA